MDKMAFEEKILGEALLATRRSLLTRLKNWDDGESWREFFQTYWKLIYSVGLKSGLTESEAEEVVQETVITVARTMDRYRYEPEKCRFKTWLMRLTRMRIVDQFRKRGPDFASRPLRGETASGESWEEQIPDPTTPFVETLWDEEWHKNLIDAAMDRVKRRVKPEHYQIFYLSAVKELRAPQVAKTLGISTAQVYLVKHRVAALVKKEVQNLEKSTQSPSV
jgi:RNA polymerase sigma factor (sigma-70 family)